MALAMPRMFSGGFSERFPKAPLFPEVFSDF